MTISCVVSINHIVTKLCLTCMIQVVSNICEQVKQQLCCLWGDGWQTWDTLLSHRSGYQPASFLSKKRSSSKHLAQRDFQPPVSHLCWIYVYLAISIDFSFVKLVVYGLKHIVQCTGWFFYCPFIKIHGNFPLSKANFKRIKYPQNQRGFTLPRMVLFRPSIL